MDYTPVDSPLYRLLMNGRQLRLSKGQVVGTFYNSPMLHLIKSGYIKRYLITHDGTQSIQLIFGPDEILPLTPVYRHVYKMDLYRGPETYYYEAMVNSRLYSITIESLMENIEKDPLMYKDLLHISGTRLNSYIHRMEDMSLRTVNRRVSHILLHFADRFGEATPEGIKILAPLTHQVLADSLNLARETVTRALSRLVQKKLIRTSGKTIVILDANKLRIDIH